MVEAATRFMQEMALKPITEQQAMEGALKGIFRALDPYSDYFNQEESKSYQSSLSGVFVGIGITMEAVEAGIKILSVFENSPAEAGGLQSGDIITKADSQGLAGYTSDKAALLIKGPAGTGVKLEIFRQNKFFTVTLIRKEIKVNPVSWKIDGDVGVIRISTFNSNTASNFEQALAEVKKAGYQKILLDLRDNGGGYVDQAAKIGQMILPAGLITKLDFASDEMQDYAYYSELTNPGLIMAVLVNENSASATEILAGGIQDAENGFLVGKKTFGKGIVQSIFNVLTPEAYKKYGELYDEAFFTEEEWMAFYGVLVKTNEVMGTVKLTTGKYLTRNGREIQDVGLHPDFEAENRKPANDVDVSILRPLTSLGLSLGGYDIQNTDWERFLKASGHMTGGADGVFDTATVAAIKSFQTKNKLKVTGKTDAATTELANRLLKALVLSYDPQYAKAMQLLEMFH